MIQAALNILSTNLCLNIEEKIALHGEFTTVIENTIGDILPVALSLLSIEPYTRGDQAVITHICMLKKGNRVATGQVRIKATDIIELHHTPVDSLLSLLANKYQTIGRRYFDVGYNRIPEKTSQEFFNAILRLFPEQADDIERLARKLNRKVIPRTARAEDAAVEKDAVGLCLDIFGIDRSKILAGWEQSSNTASIGTSFLSGLTSYSAYEDDLINHDLRHLPGWTSVSSNITGIAEFKNGNKDRLTIINANRKPLEKALGVDLIYFHRKYEAFTFVQYKMMDQKVEDNRNCYYNPNQQSQEEEQKRMKRLYNILLKEQPSNYLNDYRIGNCPIFFKVCKKLQLKYDDSSIAPGAYIPLNQWEILLVDSSTRGPKGGCQIGFRTLDNRYIGTAVFVELMQRGFLGTQSIASKKIGLFIDAAIKEGHSVVYAVDERDILVQGDDDVFF